MKNPHTGVSDLNTALQLQKRLCITGFHPLLGHSDLFMFQAKLLHIFLHSLMCSVTFPCEKPTLSLVILRDSLLYIVYSIFKENCGGISLY